MAYLLAKKDAKGDLRPKIEVLRGDPKTFVAIAESLNFQWCYTSGVIAWTKEDNPTDVQINETLDRFEEHLFARLDPTRYSFNAVLHEALDGSKHIHILVPRVDLATGKSLNIAPPGHIKYIDKLRDYLNEKFQWAKPDEIAILQADVHLPHFTYSQRREAVELSFNGKNRDEKKEILHKIILQRMQAGLITTREDVATALSDYGVITSNSNANYVSVKLHGDAKAIKFKGEFYKHDFNINTYAEARARAETSQRLSSEFGTDPKKLDELYRSLRKATDSRARFFEQEYPIPPEFYRSRSAENSPEATRSTRKTNNAQLKAQQQHEQLIDRNSNASEADKYLDFSAPSNSRDSEQTAETKSSLVSVMSRLNVFNNHNFIGEVNERIESVNQSASHITDETKRIVEERERSTENIHRKIRAAEQDTRSFNDTTITRCKSIASGIQQSIRTIFTRQISECVEELESGSIRFKFSESANRATATTATNRNTANRLQRYIEQVRSTQASINNVPEFAVRVANGIRKNVNYQQLNQKTDLLLETLNKNPIQPLQHYPLPGPSAEEYVSACNDAFSELARYIGESKEMGKYSRSKLDDLQKNYLLTLESRNTFLLEHLNITQSDAHEIMIDDKRHIDFINHHIKLTDSNLSFYERITSSTIELKHELEPKSKPEPRKVEIENTPIQPKPPEPDYSNDFF